MKVIFTQGNPEERYAKTRHNVGFVVADALAQREAVTFTSSTKFSAEIAEYSQNSEKILIVKPTTYYNETGRSFRAILDFYKLAATDVMIIHDELALNFGTLRTRHGGSDAGNNGIKSINTHGGSETIRLRIGIRNSLQGRMGDFDFVLGTFSKDEQTTLHDTIIPKCLEIIDEFVSENYQITSHSLIDTEA